MTWGIVVPTPPGAEPPAPEARPLMPAWSYSRLAKWEKCPASAYYAFILKLPEPKSEAMERGTRAHADAAALLTSKEFDESTTPLSVPWMSRLVDTRNTYKNDIEAELQVAFTQDWSQTGWFARDAWCRIIFDAFIMQAGTETVLVEEHKTGKPRAEHTMQASLYAAGAHLLAPEARVVEVTINYLDLNPTKPGGVVRHAFTHDMAKKAVVTWTERAARMMKDNEYPAVPGLHCRWCAFAKSAGGPCEKA